MKTDYFRSYVVFFTTLFILTIIIGCMYANIHYDQIAIDSTFIQNFNIFDVNKFLIEVGILTISFILSSITIGVMTSLLYTLFKAFSLGIIISTLTNTYKFKGIIISIIYILVNLINIFAYVLLTYYIARLSMYILKKIFKKENININTIRYLKKIATVFTIYLVYNIALMALEPFIHKLILIIV